MSKSSGSTVSAQFDLHREVKEKIRFGQSKESFLEYLALQYSKNLGYEEAKDYINEVVADFKDYKLIQKIMRSTIVQEASGRKNYILDPKTRSIMEITRERIREVLHPKLDISDKMVTCTFSYNPHAPQQIFENDCGDLVYNQYNPPFWQQDYFYSGGKTQIKKCDQLPKLYKEFLLHLVDGDQASFEYILDWLANALQRRNFCILATIGMVGVGKGRLGDIMKALFGESNYGETGQRILSERFNSQIKNRRIIYCDEVSVKNELEHERLKVLVNNALEVEAKGKDAEQIINYASIYFSSNSMDAIRLEAKDRRFSIVNLTNVQLKDVWSFEKIDSLTAKENIEQLAQYLTYHIIKHRMIDVFTSERTQEIREAGLASWHDWLLDDYAMDKAGQTIKIEDIAEIVADKYGPKYRPSRVAFQRLEKQFPDKIKVFKPKIDGKQIWAVKFPEKTASIQINTEVLSKSSH